MNEKLKDELYRLAVLGREHGLHEAVRWLMARLCDKERATRRRWRKRKVTLLDKAGRPMRGATFYVDAEVLKQAQEWEREESNGEDRCETDETN